MLKLTRRQDYAILAISHLSGPHLDQPVSARSLAEASGIPPAILANILKDLCRAGLIRSERGARGGYALAVDPARLTVGALLRSLEGPSRLVECVELPGERACGCDLHQGCPTSVPLQKLHRRIQEVLDEVSFDQLASQLVPPAQGPFPVLVAQTADGPDEGLPWTQNRGGGLATP